MKYATGGCPVKIGHNWAKEETHVAVMRGPHESNLAENVIALFPAEAKGKVASKQACMVIYDDIKVNILK